MQRLIDLLEPAGIHLDLAAGDMEGCLAAMAEGLAERGVLEPEAARALAAELRAREKLGPTAIGHGVAIPHAYLKLLPRSTVAFARLREPVAYATPDGAPVDLLFLLAGPESAQRDHLRLLAHIVRILHDTRLLDELRRADTAEAARACLEAAERRHG